MDFWDSIPPEVLADAQAGTKHGLRAVAKAPKVEDRFQFYWLAYQELGDERQLGMSPGPIPPSKIKQYCEDEELDPLESEALFYVIRTVDRHERARAAQQMRDEQNKKSKVRR